LRSFRLAMGPPVPSTCLFIPELPSDLTDTLLERHFRGFVGFTSSRTRRDRNGKIVGFVEFETVDDASRCRDSMQGTSSFAGLTWQIHFSNNTRGPGAPPAQKRPREDDFGLPSAQALRTNSYGAGPMESDRLAAPIAPIGRPGYGQPPPYAAPLPDMHIQPPSANFLAMQLPPDASSTLYVEGLPADATEREVAHIFRRFEGQGYQSLRMVARESSKTPGRNLHLCFVEFDNAHQATIAMRQLQGYRLDKNSTEPGVKIVYAKTRAARGAARPASSRPPRNDMYDSAPAAYDDRARAHDGRHADRHQERGHRRDGREHSDSYQDDYDDSERGEEDLLGE